MKTPDDIYLAAMEAIQPAEEIGGPERQDYVALMARIATECTRRLTIAATGTHDKTTERPLYRFRVQLERRLEGAQTAYVDVAEYSQEGAARIAMRYANEEGCDPDGNDINGLVTTGLVDPTGAFSVTHVALLP